MSACDTLATYCDAKCAGNTSKAVHDDCVATAAAGNDSTCVAWQATNSSLCKP